MGDINNFSSAPNKAKADGIVTPRWPLCCVVAEMALLGDTGLCRGIACCRRWEQGSLGEGSPGPWSPMSLPMAALTGERLAVGQCP